MPSNNIKNISCTLKNNETNIYGFVIIVGLIASLLASILLLDFSRVFYSDWNNHLWMIEFFGESIKHLNVPDMINTKQLVGIPLPIFYAQKFYVLSGVLSTFLGSAITIRIMVLIVFILQFFQVYRAATHFGSNYKISICIAVIVTWAIYPLTNLYNRSALTEFFAVAFLTCSLTSFLCVIINSISIKRTPQYDLIATGLFFVAAAVTHPITALYGAVFLSILGLIALFFCEQSRKLWLMIYFSITSLFSLLILSPWIYLLYLYKNKLTMTTSGKVNFGAGYYRDNLDNVWSRLSPFPLDIRSIANGVQGVSTPYLDAQIILPFIILISVFIYIGWRERKTNPALSISERAIVWGSVVIMLVAFVVSIYPKISDWAGGFFDMLQFPYRLISYINLSALVIVIILAGRISSENIKSKQIMSVCLGFCIALSFSALLLKLVHAQATPQKTTHGDIWMPVPFGSNKHLIELPPTYYGAEEFSVTAGFAQSPLPGTIPIIHRSFDVLEETKFGQAASLAIELKKSTLVITNIQPFPWNQIVVDGLPQTQSTIIVTEGREAIVLPKGKHTLNIVTLNNRVWRCLNILSWVTLLLWIMLYIVFTLFLSIKFARNNSLFFLNRG